MTSLLILIPLSLILLAVACAGFLWAVRNEQFEDLESEGWRVLFDEDSEAANPSSSTEEEESPS